MANGSNVTIFSTGAKHKPILDEAGFEQLLAAAFVLQQHNDTLRASHPDADPMAVLSKLTVVDSTAAEDAKRPVQDAPFPPVREILQVHELTKCPVCGRQLGTGEEFCGGCGTRRPARSAPDDLQGKWASLWYMSQAQYVFLEKDSPAQEAHAEPAEPSIAKETVKREIEEKSEKPVEEKSAEKILGDINLAGSPGPFIAASRKPLDEWRQESKPLEVFNEPEFAAEPLDRLTESIAEPEFTVEQPGVSFAEESVAKKEPSLEKGDKPKPADENVVDQEAKADEVTAELPSERAWPVGIEEIESEYRQDLWRRLNAGDQGHVIEVQVDNEGAEYFNYDQQEQAVPDRLQALWSKAKSSAAKTMGLALCAVMLLGVLWVFRPNPSAQSPHSRLQSLLVQLGLAQSSHQDVYSGNPKARVWVDVHTALYYCPGSELYGKTPGGRFSKQRVAQEDQFEPSTNVPCD